MIRLNNQLLKIGNQFIPYIYGLPLRPESQRIRQRRLSRLSMANFIKDMREQGGRDADMYVRIHYIDQINPKDSTQFTWGVTDPLLIN